MKRLWLNVLWHCRWRWRKPQTRQEVRRKLEVSCCRLKPYTHAQLMETGVRFRTYNEAECGRNPIVRGQSGWRKAVYEEWTVTLPVSEHSKPGVIERKQ